MSKEKEIKGEYHYDQDSKRYHRYSVECNEGIVGMIYIPKSTEKIPDRIVLTKIAQP